MAEDIKTESNEIQVVAFKLRKEEYGFSILNVKEIRGLTDITRVPFAPDFVKGVINLRGSVLPVIDLKKRLGLQPMEYTDSTRILIVQSDGIDVGMIVDAVTEVLTIDVANIDSVKQYDSESRFLTGVGKIDDRLIIMLSLDEIIGSIEND